MFGPFFKQTYAALGNCLILFTTGYNMGLTSLIIPKLRDKGSGFNLTLDQESWLVSISLPMLWFGLTTLSFLMSAIGRKYTILVSIVPVISANIALSFATTYTALAVGMFFLAMGGAGSLIGGCLVGEFSSPRLRGLLLALRGPFITAGILIAHMLGALSISWRIISLIATAPMIIAFTIIITCPESPVWLAAKGKIERCRKAYFWYRGDHEHEELEDLIRIQTKDMASKKRKFKNFANVKTYLLNRKFLRALCISIACLIIIDCSGKQIFMSMSVDITARILGHELNFNVMYYLLSLDFADFLSTILVCSIVKRFKRRTLLFSVMPVSLVFLFTFCLLSFLTSRGVIAASYTWVSFLFLMAYFLLQTSTLTVAYTLIYEVYPYSHKSIALLLQHAIFCSILFIFLKLTPGWINQYGPHGSFLINGVIVIIALSLLYILVPETSEKTLLNIENEMQGDKTTRLDQEQATKLNIANRGTAKT